MTLNTISSSLIEQSKRWLKSCQRIRKRHPLVFALVGGATVYGIFFAISYNRLDPDFGWHLVTGRYILAHGIPHHDSYTYTARGHPWIDHEWGNDVIQAVLYNIGGYLLSAIVFALVWTTGLLLIGWGKRTWVLALAAFAVAPYAGVRPLAWSVLLFAVTFRILKAKNKNWRFCLPLLFIAWANLHAGFIAGLALIVYFAVIELNLALIAIFLLSAAVALVNPYGINLYREIADTLFDPYIHDQITEWRSFYITTPSRPYVLLWVAGFLVYAKPFWKRWVRLGPLLLVAALDASRNLPLFIVATVAEFDNYAGHAIKQLSKPKLFIQKVIIIPSALLIILVAAYVAYVTFYPYQSRTADYPVKAVAYLKEHKCSGNLFNDYNYGGFLIWQLPGTPVYIDGRMVTWTTYMNRYLDIINKPARYYPEQFKHYNVKCALLTPDTGDQKLIDLLEKRGWAVKVSADGAVLLEAPS